MNENTATAHTLAELETLAHAGPSPLLGWDINGDEIGWNDRGRDLIIHAEHPAVADEVDGVALALALQLRYRHAPDRDRAWSYMAKFTPHPAEVAAGPPSPRVAVTPPVDPAWWAAHLAR